MDFILNEYHRNTPDEELIADARRVAELCKKETLSMKEYIEHGKYSYVTLRNRFGSWNEVLKRAGLSVTKGRLRLHDYCESDEKFFDDIRRVAKKLNRDYITTNEYERYGKYNCKQRVKKYGIWNNVLKIVGLAPSPHRNHKRYSEKELFAEMERIWIKIGRQPIIEIFRTKGATRISAKSYINRFGSWRKALEAFVTYINSEDEDEKSENVPIFDKQKVKTDNKTEVRHKTKRDINLRLRFKVMARDHFKCCKCGKSPATDPSVVLHIDHIFPYSKGGETVMENLQTLCSDCNLGKSDLIIVETKVEEP